MDEITIKQYALMVKEVRDKQNEYFDSVKRNLPALGYKLKSESIALERKLDEVTREIITG